MACTLDNLEIRHHRADDRAIERAERLEPKAEALIGQLMRDGKIVHYVNVGDLRKGKTREGSRADLIAFLIRNKYVQ